MNLVRWQPRSMVRTNTFGEPEDMQREMERIFNWAWGDHRVVRGQSPMIPAVDVTEEESRYIVHADLPGLTKDDIEVTYQDGCLTLQGEKKVEKKEEKSEQGDRVRYRERFEGRFGRSIHLPEKVDAEKIEASFKDGVLELILPFIPEVQPRKIQINQ
jgi:HSP20 family protein